MPGRSADSDFELLDCVTVLGDSMSSTVGELLDEWGFECTLSRGGVPATCCLVPV